MFRAIKDLFCGTPDEQLADLHADLELAETAKAQAEHDIASIKAAIERHEAAQHGRSA